MTIVETLVWRLTARFCQRQKACCLPTFVKDFATTAVSVVCWNTASLASVMTSRVRIGKFTPRSPILRTVSTTLTTRLFYFGVRLRFSDFGLGQEVQNGRLGAVNISVPGVGSTDEGALFVTPHGNDDNFAIATPNGSSWDVLLRDNGVGSGEGDQLNHVYLPYDRRQSGCSANQSGRFGRCRNRRFLRFSLEMIDLPGDFDPTARPAYRLTIPGKSPDDGVLMLTATGDIAAEDNSDNSVVYIDDPDPAHPDSFLILGLDHRDGAADPNPFVIPEETGFSIFAFIDYDAPPTLGPLCDFRWRRTFVALVDIDMLVMEVAGWF